MRWHREAGQVRASSSTATSAELGPRNSAPSFFVGARLRPYRYYSRAFNGGSMRRPGFPVLYLGQDRFWSPSLRFPTLLGSPLPGQAFVPNPASPWTIINITVQLSRIVNLCRPSQRRLIETTAQELTGDWRGYSLRNPNAVFSPPYWTNVPTQKLGTSLYAVRGIEGFFS